VLQGCGAGRGVCGLGRFGVGGGVRGAGGSVGPSNRTGGCVEGMRGAVGLWVR